MELDPLFTKQPHRASRPNLSSLTLVQEDSNVESIPVGFDQPL